MYPDCQRKSFNGTYVADVRSGQADVTVKTTLNGKSRDYIFHLTSGLGNSSLANLVVKYQQSFTDTSKYLTLSPVFDSTKTSYTVSYLATKGENKEKVPPPLCGTFRWGCHGNGTESKRC